MMPAALCGVAHSEYATASAISLGVFQNSSGFFLMTATMAVIISACVFMVWRFCWFGFALAPCL